MTFACRKSIAIDEGKDLVESSRLSCARGKAEVSASILRDKKTT
jgi:hypothetical protein